MAKIKEEPFVKHYTGSLRDAPTLKLMNRHKEYGYQVYWLCNEYLQCTDNGAVTQSDLEIISETILRLPYEKAKPIIETCVEVGLLAECTVDDKPAISSPLIDSQRAEMLEIRKKKQEAVAERERLKREREAEDWNKPSGFQFPTKEGNIYEPSIGKLREWSRSYKKAGECLDKIRKWFNSNVNHLRSIDEVESYIEGKLKEYQG